jgi:hypothetical protein
LVFEEIAMSEEKSKTDKKFELISKISEIADEMTLKYLEALKQHTEDADIEPKERLKAFTEMDKVLRISKLFSDRELLAQGKATENIGVGGMNRPFNVLITKTYDSEDKEKGSDD